MAVTDVDPTVDEDVAERVVLSVSALYEVLNPEPNVRDWLEFVVSEFAASHEPGSRIELPTGESILRLVLVVPDPRGDKPMSLSHAAEHHPHS